MKKIFLIMISAILILSLGTSCGADWQLTKKGVQSSVGSGLERRICVYDSLTGETLFNYEGKASISGNSSAGDVTVVYYDSWGVAKKADFLGRHVCVTSIEL